MGKKSKQDVLVPYDFLSIFETLVKQGKAQAAAELSIAIIRYDRDGTAPDFTDDGVGFVWESVVRPKLDEYKKAYEEVGEKRRAAVNSRYRYKSEQVNTNVDNSIQDEQMNTNVHHNHNDNHNHNHNLNNIIPSNIQTTSSNSSDINNNIYISNEPVDNSQQPVDKSNAQQTADTVRPASLDGMDLYNLSSPEAFNLFRLEYPRHQGALRDVQAAWLTAIAGGAAPGDLVMAGRKYARQVREEKTEQKYIAMPQTFLRDRWRDYIPKYSPGCQHCHGQGVYETDAGMIMCDCDRRYG